MSYAGEIAGVTRRKAIVGFQDPAATLRTPRARQKASPSQSFVPRARARRLERGSFCSNRITRSTAAGTICVAVANFLPCARAQRAAIRANTPVTRAFPAAIGSESVATGTRGVAAGSIRAEADSFKVAFEAVIVFVHTKSAVRGRPSFRYGSDLSAVAVVLLCLGSALL
jgi:hypothetical protein